MLFDDEELKSLINLLKDALSDDSWTDEFKARIGQILARAIDA